MTHLATTARAWSRVLAAKGEKHPRPTSSLLAHANSTNTADTNTHAGHTHEQTAKYVAYTLHS
mgnify:CR=1 FL=1